MFDEIFDIFPPERERKLRSIERYSMFDVFFYRSTLWHHQLRVALIVQVLSEYTRSVFPEYDSKKAHVLALVHDDAEMVTGDIQLAHKQRMTVEELQKLDGEEAEAIEELVPIFPTSVGGYNYRELLYHALRKDCIEAQVVSYADKLDAYCESLHEVLGGNISALRSVINYVGVLETFGEKYPDLKPLIAVGDEPFLNLKLRTDPLRAHKESYQNVNKPHTRESIERETELPVYNKWKDLVLKNMGEEGMQMLTRQKEFL